MSPQSMDSVGADTIAHFIRSSISSSEREPWPVAGAQAGT